jgi:outer membrane protein assembly factor BamB
MLRYLIPIFLCHVQLLGFAAAADWPQILGPQRNGQADEKLPAKFPASGPLLEWSVRVGQGYAGPVVQGERVVLFHRVEDLERLECWSQKTGQRLWKADFPAKYAGGIDPDLGPRCVPVIAGESVIVYGAAGDCRCVELGTGKEIWSRSLAKDYASPDGYFGAGSTPLVMGDRILVNVGGKKAGIVGLELATGKTVFAIAKEQASYSSPTAYQQGKDRFALFLTRMNVVRVDPVAGEATILFPFGKTGPTVNAAVPLVIGEQLFVTSSYGVGASLRNLAQPATPVWENDDSFSSQYSTPVVLGEHLYGTHGREDIPPAHLRCVELKTGKVAWSRDDFGVAHVIRAEDRLLLLTVAGELVLAKASPAAYEELDRATVAKAITRAIPALSQGHVYFRTNAGSGGELKCLRLSE